MDEEFFYRQGKYEARKEVLINFIYFIIGFIGGLVIGAVVGAMA